MQDTSHARRAAFVRISATKLARPLEITKTWVLGAALEAESVPLDESTLHNYSAERYVLWHARNELD